jgi:hypothetical protein
VGRSFERPGRMLTKSLTTEPRVIEILEERGTKYCKKLVKLLKMHSSESFIDIANRIPGSGYFWRTGCFAKRMCSISPTWH